MLSPGSNVLILDQINNSQDVFIDVPHKTYLIRFLYFVLLFVSQILHLEFFIVSNELFAL